MLDLEAIKARLGQYVFTETHIERTPLDDIRCLVKEVERLRHENAGAFESGLRAVRRIRCLEHRDVPQYNTKEASGAECAACEVERLRTIAGDLADALSDFNHDWASEARGSMYRRAHEAMLAYYEHTGFDWRGWCKSNGMKMCACHALPGKE